jgi:hypothetical protein
VSLHWGGKTFTEAPEMMFVFGLCCGTILGAVFCYMHFHP